MNRFRAFLVSACVLAMLVGPIGPPAHAAAIDGSYASVAATAKKKCKKFKGKKKRNCLKNSAKGGSGKGGKPWAGSDYRPGIVCSLSVEKQRVYAKYGLICIDVGFGITTLTEI